MEELSINLLGLDSDVISAEEKSESSTEPTSMDVCRLCLQSCMNSTGLNMFDARIFCIEDDEFEMDDHECIGDARRTKEEYACQCACNIESNRNMQKVHERWFV
jgi:hypothetical protein